MDFFKRKSAWTLLILPFLFIPFPHADCASDTMDESLERRSLPKLEDWMLYPNTDSFPMLSNKGREARQFRMIVQAIEQHLERNLEPAEVCNEFMALFQSLLEHFGAEENLNQYDPEAVRQVKALTGLVFAEEPGQLVLTGGGKTKKISLKKRLDKIAEETIKNSAKLLGKEKRHAIPVLWVLWVEACLEVLNSPYNYYIYADELAASDAIRTGKTFGPGLIPEVSGEAVIAKNVFDPYLLRSGLVEGCELIEIDGEPLRAENRYRFDAWIRLDNFSYRISFKTGSETKTVEAKAVPYRYPTLTWTMWQEVVYVRISRFSRDSLIELRRLFRRLENQPPLGLILDLRGNPGGTANFGIVDCFFKPEEVIGTYREKSGDELQTVEGSIEYYDYPIILLVDDGSASMSEVFAAAVKTNGRGLVIGEKTFGKGVGQSCELIEEEGNLCLVQYTFYYPGTEETWDERGILPDVAVDVTDDAREQIDAFLSTAIPDLASQITKDAALKEALRVLGETGK